MRQTQILIAFPLLIGSVISGECFHFSGSVSFKSSLFIRNSNLTRCPVFCLAASSWNNTSLFSPLLFASVKFLFFLVFKFLFWGDGAGGEGGHVAQFPQQVLALALKAQNPNH